MLLLLTSKDIDEFEMDSQEKSKLTNFYGRKEKTLDRPLFTHPNEYEPSSFSFILKSKIADSVDSASLTPVYKRNYKLKGIKCLNDKEYSALLSKYNKKT